MGGRVIAVVPTYNEAENIEELIRKLRALDVEVLVVDDRSPDGTWQIVERMSGEDAEVHLLVRDENRGRGFAGREGFIKALEMGADMIVEMDADFSHRPEDLPRLLEAASKYDVVLGSRLVPGGEDVGRGWFRRVLTKLSCAYARAVLGIGVRDVNSGYRVFTREAMKKIDPYRLRSAGPAIVHESLYYAHKAGLNIGEVPIRFVERARGESNLGMKRLLESALRNLKLRILGHA